MNCIVETKFIEEKLERVAFEVEDIIEVSPITGKRQRFGLNRTQIDFVSEDNVKNAGNYYRLIPTLKGDSVFIRLRQIKSSVKNNHRVLIESLNSRPFLFNGSLVLSAILKNDDECDVAHNLIKFKKKKEKTQSFTFNQDLIEKKKIIKSKMNILLEGETGTGKTTLARKIHDESGRTGPFVHINLSAFSSTLLESELFGHTKGAFTGATRDKVGALRQSHRGTLFLDEIDSIPIELQTKLLLFLDNSHVRPVGSMTEYNVDTRLIFASGTSLIKNVELGLMRKDFYFRLQSGHRYQLQSLRSSPESIEKFCLNFEIDNNLMIDKKLINFYQTLPWPGNIRQLASHLKRKQITSTTSTLSFDSCDDELIIQSSELSMLASIDQDFMTLKQVKNAYAKKVFYKLNCNYEKASKILEISSKSLRTIMNQ